MKKATLTRTLIGLLALVMLMGTLLTSCNNSNQNNSDDTGTGTESDEVTTAEPEPEVDLYEDLRGLNYGNKEFTVYTYDDKGGWALYFEEVEGAAQILNDATYERNGIVEEMLHVVLNIERAENGFQNIPTNVMMQAMAGKGYDLVVPYATTRLDSLLLGNYVYNLQDLEYLTLESDWYNQSANKNFTFKNKQYFMVSDYTYPVQQRFAYLANIDMIEDRGVLEETEYSSIYDMVSKGDWTLENLNLMIKDVYTSPNGDVEKTVDCTYGLATNLNTMVRTLQNWGEDMVSMNDDGEFVINLFGGTLDAKYDALMLLTHSQDTYCVNYADKFKVNNDYYTMFTDGRAMFATYSSDPWQLTRDEYQALHFAYLPYPKFQAEDDYVVVSHGGLMFVSAQAKDPEFASAVIEALSIASHEEMRDAYIQNYFEGRVIQDPEGVEMYQIIRDKAYYDFGRYVDPSTDNQGNPLAASLLYFIYPLREQLSLASRYEAYGQRVQTAYDLLYSKLQ